MKLYTFIMGFEGGKYISQIKAEDETTAMQEWAHLLDVSKIQGMKEKGKADLILKLRNESPVKICDCECVWSFLVLPLGKACDVDIIQTDLYK